MTRKLTDVVSQRMGLGAGAGLSQRSAAMYGMMASLPNRGDIRKLAIDALDRMTHLDPGEDEILPDSAHTGGGPARARMKRGMNSPS